MTALCIWLKRLLFKILLYYLSPRLSIEFAVFSSPLSSFGSSLLQDKVYLDKDFIFNYKAVADSEKVIRGATYFIKNGDKLEGILCEYLDFTLLDSDKPLSLRQRENAVQVLFDKGIFNIKGAIPMVAKYLKISEPSVYRYLKAIKEKV